MLRARKRALHHLATVCGLGVKVLDQSHVTNPWQGWGWRRFPLLYFIHQYFYR